VRDDIANIEHVLDPKNGWISLIPEGLTLARIENLEAQLKEANEVAEFCSNEKGETGRRARAYLKKWEEK
jgi:hypothetical protein